jgi:hypothetical protein
VGGASLGEAFSGHLPAGGRRVANPASRHRNREKKNCESRYLSSFCQFGDGLPNPAGATSKASFGSGGASPSAVESSSSRTPASSPLPGAGARGAGKQLFHFVMSPGPLWWVRPRGSFYRTRCGFGRFCGKSGGRNLSWLSVSTIRPMVIQRMMLRTSTGHLKPCGRAVENSGAPARPVSFLL